MVEAKILQGEKRNYIVHPVRFNLWLFLVTVTMLFMAFTSAYIVRRAEGNWLYFDLPILFAVTTGIIVFASVLLQAAVYAARKNELAWLKILLWGTTLFGLAFVTGQFLAWQDLVANKIFVSGNVAGTFLYIISGLHAIHVVGGIVVLGATLYSTYHYKVHSKEMLRISLCTTYWHFMTILWVYLYIFLLLFR
ncbi:MAG: cytochrome c oxidase subunit 3 [Bacteroidia bacterium]